MGHADAPRFGIRLDGYAPVQPPTAYAIREDEPAHAPDPRIAGTPESALARSYRARRSRRSIDSGHTCAHGTRTNDPIRKREPADEERMPRACPFWEIAGSSA